MRKWLVFLFISIIVVTSACSRDTETKNTTNNENNEIHEMNENFVFVAGGAFVNTTSNFYEKEVLISDFYISKYEVTQKEWLDVMGSNPSAFIGENLPVEMVSWYDVIEYCNKRSIQEGLKPYYNIDMKKKDPKNNSEYDNMKWTVTINEGANGYRLPTEAEWEYASSGGQMSAGYTYSGSDEADEVAWYWKNAGDNYLTGDWNWPIIESNKNQTKTVGSKEPNELGIHDMSGNVREWVWNWYDDVDIKEGLYRVVKGGGWIGDISNNEISFRGKFEANGFGPDQGFRVSRSD
ncbi:MAG TPA: formylglycine-generating enzyme family protein [Candidatus Paenibacillus intestinavium]|nr:formylglycine-generating enzyme family protein [Candidatus Paenibacillus intestinavium]